MWASYPNRTKAERERRTEAESRGRRPKNVASRLQNETPQLQGGDLRLAQQHCQMWGS